MNEKRVTETRPLHKTDLIVVTGAGGFIGGNLVKYFWERGFTRLRAVDKKPFDLWYQRLPGVENLQGDCSQEEACQRACHGATEVYNLAADMGGMGFIERFRVDCLRSVLINTQMIEAAYQAGVQRYFFSSSACVYNTLLQQNPSVLALKESDAYPAMAERGYGWEKAHLRDVLRRVLGRARHEDIHRSFPQRLRSARHLGRRSRKSPCSHLSQSRRSGRYWQQHDPDLG
jgi:nucleoside-diphosphate-sugar epimerase